MSSKADNLVGSIRAEFIAFIVLTTIAISVRFWSTIVVRGSARRRGSGRVLWWDDWFALAGAVFSVALCGTMFHWSTIGLGTHQDTVSPENVETGLKLLYAIEVLYDTAISLPKLSALCFYARVLGINRRFKIALWIVGALVTAWWIQAVLEAFFQCTPIEKAWLPHEPGTCINFAWWYAATAITSVMIDAIVLLMPLPLLWRLHLKPMKKFGIVLVFLSGYLVIGISIGRLVEVSKAGQALNADLTYNIVAPGYWMASEGPVSVISVCLPNIYSLIARGLSKRSWSKFTRSSRRGAENSEDRNTLDRTTQSGHGRHSSLEGPLLSSRLKTPEFITHERPILLEPQSSDEVITQPPPTARNWRSRGF